MPALNNPKHEAFAQERASGKSADHAYALAGYKPHRGNAARMSANEILKARVSELLSESASKVTNDIAYETRALFDRLTRRANAAEEAGDFRTAISADKFIIECFGYKDSPTMTHEHMATDKKLISNAAPTRPLQTIRLTKPLKAMYALRARREAQLEDDNTRHNSASKHKP